MAADIHGASDASSALVNLPIEPVQWLAILPVAIPLIVAAMLLMLRRSPNLQAPLAVAGLAALVVCCGFLLLHVTKAGPLTMMMGSWLPPFGIAFTADVLGASFALVASVVGFFVCLYSFQEVSPKERAHGYFSFLLLMKAGICGCLLTGDIFNVYVWLEVVLISSFGLIVFGSQMEQLDGAMKYAFMNLVATTLFLLATAFLYGAMGTLNMADIVRKMPERADGVPIATIGALFLLALGMKAAAFPVNFWLPASYHTPRIVVSALFAGLLTKLGIYALLRINVMLLADARDMLAQSIAVVAVLTMLVGAFGALAQTDIRRIAGYLVISGIGSMMAGIAVSGTLAISGVVLYAYHSMIMLTVLYLLAGTIAYIAGSFDIRNLGGLYRRAPVLAVVFFIAFLAISGLPPMSGFWPKYALVKSSLDAGAWVLAATLLFAGLTSTIALGRIWAYVFWRNQPAEAGQQFEAEGTISLTELMRLGMGPIIALTSIGVLLGIAPGFAVELSLQSAVGILAPVDYIGSVFPN